MRILSGKKIYEMTADQLCGHIVEKNPVCMDVGTGSGRFVLTKAKENGNGFYIGMDPVSDNMKRNSLKAQKLINKKLMSNLLYVIASIEKIPCELEGLFDIVTVHLPWGSLRDGIVTGNNTILDNLRRLGKPGTELTMLIGYDEQNEYFEMERRKLPPLSVNLFENLAGSYFAAGISISSVSVLDNKELRYVETDWAKRLAFGSPRQIYKLICRYL